MAGASWETRQPASASQGANQPRAPMRRRSRPTFFLVIAIFLAATSLKSTKGGFGNSVDEHHQHQRGIAEHDQPKHQNYEYQYEDVKESDLPLTLSQKSGKTGTETGQNEPGKTEEVTTDESAKPKGAEKETTTEKSRESTSTNNPRPTSTESNSAATSSSTEEPPPRAKNETSNGNGTEETTTESEYCVPPAIQQFPRPLLSQNIRKHGGFLMYLLIGAYTFLALAIVCDEFFVPSLDIICELLKISPDVAGATFMAAGSSAPELATALIGVFVAKDVDPVTGDDIGVSGVIGSAVFNIMFVISLCGLITTTPLYLNWWPMFRDCFFYMISILALLITILDEEIEWYESVVLLILYCLYCYAMYMNTVLEAWAHTLPIPFPVVHAPVPDENSGLVTYKSAPKNDHGATAPTIGGENIIVEGLDPTLSNTGLGYGQDAWGDGVGGMSGGPAMGMDSQMGNAATQGLSETGAVGGATEPPKKVPPQAESILAHLNPPAESSLFKKILWRISSPLIYLFYYTVPDCRLEAWKSWYLVTFIVSMVWIAIFSYVMVWMITVVGFTAGIPDTVMGLTFVAAGVSVPDALSSLAVVKEGFGDMAVSNAIGSNVFDILICLGLPWFLSTVVVHPGVPVKVISKGLTYSTFSLFSTVAFLLLATHYNGWKLDKRYGILLMLWYVFFMVFASLYELNIFGPFNPRECYSDY